MGLGKPPSLHLPLIPLELTDSSVFLPPLSLSQSICERENKLPRSLWNKLEPKLSSTCLSFEI